MGRATPGIIRADEEIDAAPALREPLSLYHLLEPAVLANPYPLYDQLRERAPVYWDPFLHAWVVTRYSDVVTVLKEFSAARTPSAEQLESIGMSRLAPLARVMVRQMLFLDPPAHTRIRGLAACAFTPQRVAVLRSRIEALTEELLEPAAQQSGIDLIAELAEPLPAIITAELLGVPRESAMLLKSWSARFAEMLGNFQHNPDRIPLMLQTIHDLTEFFQNAINGHRKDPSPSLIDSFLAAEIDGDRLSDEEIVANCIITLVGGLETTTNLIGNGVLTLLRHPQALQRLREDDSLLPSSIEELLRFESPSQHTARLAPADCTLGGKTIRRRQAVIAVMAAANRDPERFTDPHVLDLARPDNRHLAFGWAAHFCFGAPLARLEGQIAIGGVLRRFPALRLESTPLKWRTNLGLRGLRALPLAISD